MRARVVLGVSGGIAAFRAVEVLRLLVKAGCHVHPILTRNAARFVTPRTFAVLAHETAQVSLWSHRTGAGIDHTELSRIADLLVVAPATANVLAKMSAGVADDALTTYALAHRRGIVLAPAMNTVMWQQPAVQDALATLQRRGARVVAPVSGMLADGEIGEGKLAAPESIAAAVLEALPRRGPLAGLRVVVSAGPTRERLDAVRVITNRSSGRMGIAVALAARELGAEVVLLAGATVAVPVGVPSERFESAADLETLLTAAGEADVLFHAAAVADFRPAVVADGKLDRRHGAISVELEPVADLAAGVARQTRRPYLVIFAAERAADLEERARRKLDDKGADAVVANPIDEEGVGMEAEDNRALVMTRQGLRRFLARQRKETLARELVLALAGELVAAARR